MTSCIEKNDETLSTSLLDTVELKVNKGMPDELENTDVTETIEISNKHANEKLHEFIVYANERKHGWILYFLIFVIIFLTQSLYKDIKAIGERQKSITYLNRRADDLSARIHQLESTQKYNENKLAQTMLEDKQTIANLERSLSIAERKTRQKEQKLEEYRVYNLNISQEKDNYIFDNECKTVQMLDEMHDLKNTVANLNYEITCNNNTVYKSFVLGLFN